MPRLRYLLTAVLMAVLLGCVLLATDVSASAAPTLAGASDPGPVAVVGSPSDASYIGSGGLIVGSTFTGDPYDRRALAECGDCRWWLVPVCWRDPVNFDAGCRSLATCPPGYVQVGVWFSRPDSDPRLVGRFCLGPAGPVTPGTVARTVRGGFVRRLPALRPGWQPAVTLTALPTIFRAGQSRTGGPWTYLFAGFTVVVRATTVWTWDFGDGSRITTTDPGGRYPNMAVAHAYRHPGSATVTVTSSWAGTFTVDGYGPFDISPGVAQSSHLLLTIREARAVLLDPA